MKENQTFRFSSAGLMLALFLTVLVLPLFAQTEGSSPISGEIENERVLSEFRRPELSTEQYTTLVMLMLDYVRRFYVDEVDPNVIFEGAMKGLFESLDDPYSQYLTFKDMEDLKETTVGDFAGIGIYHSKKNPKSLTMESDIKDGYIYVVSPIEDSPAYRAGIQPGDYITKINGESVIPLTSDDISAKLKGRQGDPVTLTILRGKDLVFDVELKRDNITIPTIKYAMIPNSIGYIRILQFTPHTAEDAQKAIESLNAQGMKALILDLRMNPGGVFNAAIRIADFFFEEGEIVSTKSRIRNENVSYEAEGEVLVPSSVPVVALIDKGSASASEVLVGALKDRERAFVIGEKSYGKGVVQNVIPGYLGTGFKLTTARYYTPSGTSIDKTGIMPDLVIESFDLSEEEEESYKKMLEEKVLDKFTEENPQATEEQINQFMSDLKGKGYLFDENIIGRFLTAKLYQGRGEMQPTYSLDYDPALKEALNYLEGKY
jgi:carboxyl-terminal processing protease